MASVKSLLCALALVVVTGQAQTQTSPQSTAAPQAAPTPDPAITQIRKSVAFIKLRCRNGNQEVDVRGTGFFVFYPDSRLGATGGFGYLVTNRHVALCWNDLGQPMQVESISITLNRNQPDGDNFAQEGFLNQHGNAPWIVPQDASVDLAAIPLLPDTNQFDLKVISVSMFASSELLKQREIVEGEPVFFAGFFYQFPGTKRMEPIVRQGILAMMPSEKIPFVDISERLYLADLHAFGGNSGSPVFINLSGYHNGSMMLGQDYRLLGVVNGEVTEDENFNLELTTTVLRGKGRANSGVSTIVPADEVRALLDDPRLQKLRDDRFINPRAGLR
jgi:hypothetical protein